LQRIAILAVLALVVVAGAFYFLASGLDGTVARYIERVGTETLGTAVHVGEVEISINEGKGRISALSVANPEGWQGGTAFKLAGIEVGIAAPSITADGPIVLTEVLIATPEVHLELDAAGRANLDQIRRQAGSASEASAGRTEEDASEDARKIRIDRLQLSAGTLSVDTSAVGGDRSELALPPVSLTEVGGHTGTSPGRIAQAVVTAVIQQAVAEAARADLEGRAGSLLRDKLGDEAAGVLEGAAGALLGGEAEEGAD